MHLQSPLAYPKLFDVDRSVVDLLNAHTSVELCWARILVNVSVDVYHIAFAESVTFAQCTVVYRNVSEQQAKLGPHTPQVNLAPPTSVNVELDIVVVANNQTLLSV
jgi:hypothetical protein